MSIRAARYLVLLIVIGVLASAQAAWATLPTPSQPILVVQNSASTDRYQNFVPELLKTEGLNGFQTAQLPELTAAFLTNYDVVILPHLTLTAAQATLFQNYVNAGGTLIGFRPDLQLASVFGVSSLGSTLSEGWLKIDTSTAYASALDGSVMKFHGTADRYSLSGASALATLYSNSTTPTTSPAAAIYSFGLGEAILFSLDLTQSIVLMRQGNPAWAGYPNNHDGFNTMRPSQMFMDEGTGQFWNDLGDDALNDVPQADIQSRLFSNALVLSNAAKRPLPRLWYFPSQNRAMLLLTGDHHNDSVSNSTTEINTIASYGGKFSNFLWYPFGLVSETQVNSWVAAGHAMGIHFNDTNETDGSGVGGSGATWNGMQAVLANATASFAATYPSAPPPTTTRNHFLIWVSRNASGNPEQTAQAKLFQNAGIELDVSYTAFPNRWGYMSGSGLPMKFLNTATGEVIPVYEQATQYEDDIQLGSFSYSLNWNLSTATTHYQRTLSDSLNKYNTVVTMLFHPDSWSTYHSYAETVLAYAQSNSIPMYSTAAWLQFWKGRVATAVSMPTFSLNTLSFTVTNAPANLTLLVPRSSGGNAVSAIVVDGTSQSPVVGTYQGVQYASVVVSAGTHNISATYAPSPGTFSIAGTISSAANGSGATVTLSGAANATTTADSSGNYAFSGLSNGDYTVTPTKSGFTFSPASRSVTVNNGNVSGINFTATAVPTYSLSGTISPMASGSGATVTLTGAASKTATADANGNYTFTQLNNGTYTVTPSKSGFTFTPSSAQATVNNANVTGINFTGVAVPTYTISGTISPTANGAGATVSLSGAASASATADSSGNYAFSGLTNGSYTLTPSRAGFTFSPANAPATVNNANVTGINFTATPNPIGQTLFTTQTPSGTNFTDGAGVNYELGMSFTSTSAGQITGIRFWKASNESGTHIGRIWSSTGTPLASVAFTGETASGWQQQLLTAPLTIAANTTYVVSVNTGNTYYVGTISGLATQVINGSLRSVVGNNGIYSPSGQFPTSSWQNSNYFRDVVFVPGATYNISGTISPAAGGSGATVTLSGAASATATADGSGNYSFTGLANGSYTVTPAKAGYTFSPASAPATINNANVTGLNFTATAIPTYTISGNVSANGSGATVTLSGTASRTATADGSGNYSFTGLANGSYTVTPSKSGFTFSPVSTAVTISSANATANFTATAIPTYSISGTISPAASGSGATVTLSGADSATTTADINGNYSFTGLANGSYTVTPSKSGYTFAPLNRAVSINSANVTGVNFTATVAVGITIDAMAFGDQTSAATTVVTSAFSTTAANELLLAFVGTDGPPSGTNNSVSSISGGGLAWVLVRRTDTQPGTAEIWRAFAATQLTNVTVTANLAQSYASSITVMSFKGVNTSGTSGSGAIGSTASGSGTTGSLTASLVTAGNNSLVVGVGEDWNAAPSVTVGPNQTLIRQLAVPNLATFWIQRQSVTTPTAGTTVIINDTVPINHIYNMTICEILAAP